MKDTLSTILAVLFLVVLLIMFPLYNYFERQDDMSYNIALKTVTTFVDDVAQNGYIDQTMYDKFLQRLATTGNTYDIEIEAQKRVLTIDPENINPEEGEETYIEQFKSYYNKDIFNDATGQTSNLITKDNSLKNDVFFLDVGDKIFVKIRNTNSTMASSILSALVSSVPSEKINIVYGSTIKNNTWENTIVSQLYQSDIVVTIDLDNPNEPETNRGYPLYNFENNSDRIFKFKVKVLNVDDTNIASKITDNIRLVGTAPNCYISPSSVTTGTDEGEYIIEFVLDETKSNTYFSSNDFNIFNCYLPANSIQGTFTKNASASSKEIALIKNESITIPKP